jgi:hypothetical protein
VIFGDGQFVGDEQRIFEQFGKKLKAITEVGILAKIQGKRSLPARGRGMSGDRAGSVLRNQYGLRRPKAAGCHALKHSAPPATSELDDSLKWPETISDTNDRFNVLVCVYP